MRIDRLYISKYKNLKSIEIDFNEDALTTVLIGENGTAKSNLLEAIVLIFRQLDLKDIPPFSYELDYKIVNNVIHIDADINRERNKVIVYINGKKTSYNKLTNDSDNIFLPKNVFGYYSGTNDRFKELFERHKDRFYQKMLNNIEPPLRPLFYAENSHAQFVLLAFFSSNNPESLLFLRNYFDIIGFNKAIFTFKQPSWYNKRSKNDAFWGARGVVRRFLDDLDSLTESEPKQDESMKRRINDLDTLNKLANIYDDNVTFFKMLESALLSDLISELNVSVIKSIDGNISFKELSEGERQLLIVFGLLKFMKEEESLFLLDEPVTHLNPKWKYEYLTLLDEVVGKNETSQLLITTHDPLVVSGLKKEQILMFNFKGEKREINVTNPKHDPIGYGVEGILTSEFFNMKTTLDIPTLDIIEQKRKLISKSILNSDELKALEKMTTLLNNAGLNFTFRDPLYNLFLKSLRNYENDNRIEFSDLEKQEQKRLAEELIKDIMVK